MTKNINIEKFTKEFEQEYDFLYENNDRVAGYNEAIEAWESFAENHREFIREFVLYRGDFLSSDREVAAFMFAMEKYM